MKTENLMKACDSFVLFRSGLREAHKDAIESKDQFAEIAILSLIQEAAKLSAQLARVKEAAK